METIFTCRCCGKDVQGFYSGRTVEKGWRFLDRIDGPNHVCPDCVSQGPAVLESLREDGFDYVCFGELCE